MRKKRLFTRLICFVLTALTITSSLFLFGVSAEETPSPPQITDGRAFCLFDKTHNKFLVSKGEDELLNTSTSAKVMMGLIACESLVSKVNETVTITEQMLQGTGGYSMQLAIGEQIKIIDLLYGAICGSYNDAAYVLASIVSGSSQGFVELMNKRAKELGALSTSYTNPIGYPDNDAMVTTLSDTLNIALAASDNELYMEICSAKRHEISANNLSGARTVYNRNYLVSSRSTQAYYNPACYGMNAGISGEKGGWSVITLARDEGADYICIVLGGSENEEDGRIYAYDTVNTLVNWAIDTYNEHRIFKKGEILGQAEIGMTALGSKKVNCAAVDDLSVYIPDESRYSVSYRIEFISDKLTAPMSKGDTVGYATVYYDGESIGKCEVILTEDCGVNAVMKVISLIGEYTKSRAFIASLVFLAIALPIAIISKSRRSNARRGYRKKY